MFYLGAASATQNRDIFEEITCKLSTLGVGLQFLATSKDTNDPAWLGNNIHHSFHSGWTLHKTFATAENGGCSTISAFPAGLIRGVFPVPGGTIGFFVFSVSMYVFM